MLLPFEAIALLPPEHATADEHPFVNQVLLSLSQSDLDLLLPGLQPVELPLRKQLEARNRRIEHVYFVDRGIASVVANGSAHSEIEIGIIGKEGVTGLAVIMGGDRSPHETYMQTLQDSGVIRAQRGGILVIDRAGLEACANGAYVGAEEVRG